MILKNAKIFDENFDTKKADIKIQGEKIAEIGSGLSDKEIIDLEGYCIAPGFVDIHIHGCMGADTCDGTRSSIETMAKHLITKGVTSFCPTTMTVSPEQIESALCAVKDYMDHPADGAAVCGVNMEGPYISPERKGAQKVEYIRTPDFNEFKKLFDKFGGIVKLIDIAPECQNAAEFITKASKLCTVSIAHSSADYAKAKDAFQHGVTHVTHLFNAMTGLTHRVPGIVGAVFDDENVKAEIICDGLHIHEAVLRTAFKILGENRTIIISDAMRAAGMPDGMSELGGQQVMIKNGEARLADGTLAGSTTNILDEIKNLYRFGIPLKQIIKSATINPAAEIGKADEIGSIRPGKKADLVAFDKDFNIKLVVANGKKSVYSL